MSSTVGPIALALNVPNTQADPTAQWKNPARHVQVQNSSAFVLNILANGENFTVQPFVAQTIPIQGGGSGIVLDAVQAPNSIMASNVTLVWLLNGEAPPMADGPLTAAAIAAAAIPPTGSANSTAAAGAQANLITHSSPTARYRLNSIWLSNITNGGTGTSFAAILATIGGVQTDLLFLLSGQIVSPSTFGSPTFADTDGGGVVTDAGTDVIISSSVGGSARGGIFFSQAAT